MNHTYKCALALTLLISKAHADCPINYKNMTMLVSAGIATTVTATMLYNFLHPENDETIIKNAAKKCQNIQDLHDNILFVHENELMIINQGSRGHTDTINRIRKGITPQPDNYSLYHYVINIDYDINQLQEKVQELMCLQTNLTHRSPKLTHDNDALINDFDNLTTNAQTLRQELNDLINKLFTIRTHVASTPEYADEAEQYRISQETSDQDDSDERYERCVARLAEIETEEEKKTSAAATSEVVAVVVADSTIESTRAPFNSDWCDATNPFNS